MPEGIVSAVFGARCEVLHAGERLPCLLRGRLRGASLVAGDRVEFSHMDARQGVVERVLPRRSELARPVRERQRRRSGPGAYHRQVVLANPDQVFFVAAAREPGIDFTLMDRALALARAASLPASLCINKMDLAAAPEIARLLRPYESLGVPVLCVSAASGAGLEALHAALRGRLSFFWGGSGVGKSSLIAALTGAEVRVGGWRSDNPRGAHTTNVTRLYPLPEGGLIADTPGFDWLELDLVEEADDPVALLLPEAVGAACRFPGCRHCGEPGCAVMAAVLAGTLDRSRYSRYRTAAAESHPPRRLPLDVVADGDRLLFRHREGPSTRWIAFTFADLLLAGGDGPRGEPAEERTALLGTLGAGLDAEPLWMALQQMSATRPPVLEGKASAGQPVERLLTVGEEVVLRERGVVRGLAQVETLVPSNDPWRLRKGLRGTALSDGPAFWTDVKAPGGRAPVRVHAARVTLRVTARFDVVPQLLLGALTRGEGSAVLDLLEVGSGEDELARE